MQLVQRSLIFRGAGVGGLTNETEQVGEAKKQQKANENFQKWKTFAAGRGNDFFFSSKIIGKNERKKKNK